MRHCTVLQYVVYPDPGREDDEYPVDDHEDGEEAQQQEPEPDEDVDLLIHCNTKN